MAFRPQWYDDEPRRRSFTLSAGSWSAIRLILTVTLGVYAVEVLVFVGAGRQMGPLALFWDVLGLRAWMGEGGGTFNPFFPVQAVTYMLVHDIDVWHVGWNMFLLWMFGRNLEAMLGRDGFLRLYLTAGVFGGLCQWLANLVGGDTGPIIGASGAVYAIMMLYALKWPRQTIFVFIPIPIPLPVILIMGFKVLSDLSGFIAGDPSVAFLAHLGGALIGFVWFRRGDVVAQAQVKHKLRKAEKKAESESTNRREMDRILAKIQAEGLSSLSPSERAFLDRRSRELRDGG